MSMTYVSAVSVPSTKQREAAFRDGAYWGREARVLGVPREQALKTWADEVCEREADCAADLAAGFVYGFDR